jgi:hypothetical protein
MAYTFPLVSYLSTANSSAFQFGTGEFSISQWVNPFTAASHYRGIISVGRFNNGIMIRSQPSGLSGNDNLYIANISYNYQPYNYLTVNKFNHLVLTRIGTNVLMYINNSVVLSVTNSSNIAPVDSTFIGSTVHVPANTWDGQIAETAIWGAGLTAAEVNSLYVGFSANQIRPQSLLFYAPLISNLIDVSRGLAITNNNGATPSTHPRIYT